MAVVKLNPQIKPQFSRFSRRAGSCGGNSHAPRTPRAHTHACRRVVPSVSDTEVRKILRAPSARASRGILPYCHHQLRRQEHGQDFRARPTRSPKHAPRQPALPQDDQLRPPANVYLGCSSASQILRNICSRQNRRAGSQFLYGCRTGPTRRATLKNPLYCAFSAFQLGV